MNAGNLGDRGGIGPARLLFLAAVGAAGLAASCIVVTGRRGDEIRFSEAAHADLMGNCDACHEGIVGHAVDSSTRRALEAKCLECHGDRRDDCSWCHSDVASAGRFPDKERALSFSHETHLERTHGDCAVCHAGAHGLAPSSSSSSFVAAAATPEGAAFDDPAAPLAVMPAHAECFSCHQMQEFYDRLECRTCHEDLARYGLQPYESFTHAGDFVGRGHAELLRSTGNAAVCAQCHEPSMCDTCHAVAAGFDATRVTPALQLADKAHLGLIHRGDYLFRHPWDARADPASCSKCHSHDYCLDCHEQRGLSERGAAARNDGFRFHGPGVLFKGSPDYHGTAARRDPMSCAACHDEGSRANCTNCHQEGAFGGNPHPKHFKSRLDKRSAAVCRLCHVK